MTLRHTQGHGEFTESMKKHLVIITPYFAPAWSYGGPPKVLHTLAKELENFGFNITVITSDALDQRRNNIQKESIDGIQVYRYKNLSNYLAYYYKIFFIPDFLNLIKESLLKADYILFSDLRPIIHWQIYKFIKDKKIPYGIFAFGQIPYDSGFKYMIKWLFDRLWVKDFVRNARIRLSQTEHETEMYLKYFGLDKKSIHMLPLPVNVPNISIKSTNIYKRFHLRKNDFITLFVGRLNYLKGIDILLESIIPIIEGNKNVKLLLVGRDDGVEKQIRKLIPQGLKSNIIITGPLFNEQVYALYKISSCFVFTPRYYEETSLAALEALSFGMPAIVTREAAIPYLEQYGAGKIVSRDPEEIQNAIREEFNLWKNNRNMIRKNAKRLAKEKYNVKNVAKRLSLYIDKNI